ncbi:MAG: hypothetical protein ACI8RD_004934 [Bacillariaceae sp.]|jgi:hypothetical protein
MAAEFDISGFSAVDKFFGNDGTENKSTERISSSSATKEQGHVVGSKGKRRRGGVGTSNDGGDDSKKLLSSDMLSKKILNVGRKRRSREDDVDDDDEDYIDGGDHGVNDDDEEMIDGGRTNIVEKSTLSKKGKSVTGSSDKLTNDQAIEGKKKKLGKKERQKQKLQEETSAAVRLEVFEPVAESSAHEQDDAEDTKDSSDKTGLITHNNTEKYPSSKKKRRKVRSRQKNIYKDNRTRDEKPAHLTKGNPNYQGRPMTQATREKLNLPPPTKKIRPHSYNNNSSKNQDDNTLFVIDRSPDSPVGGGGDDVGVKLAIDDFMNTDDTTNSKEIKDDDNKDLKKKKREKSAGAKKNKKNRFKNCR